MNTRKTTLRLKIRKRFTPVSRGKLHGYFMGFGLLVLLSISNPIPVDAQCSMACNKQVQISIDTSCYTEILPDMILEAPQQCPNGRFEVIVMDKDTIIASSPHISPEYLWKNLTVKVRDQVSNNSCWGKIYVEDKQPPIIVCRDDTMHCNEFPYYEGPEMIERCDTGATLQLLRETANVFVCDPEFTKRVTRYYVAEDKYGNRSPICTVNILLRRVPIDSIEYPKDRIAANDCALACDSIFKVDENGNPHPDVTGVPLLDSIPLWPDYTAYCNISVDYKDKYILEEACKKKILRTWRVVEWWCSEAIIRSYPQVIEILDEEGPVITCPRDWHITTDGGYQCQATIDLPPAEVYDICAGDSVTVDVHYPGGVLKNSNGGRITLPAGDHLIEYIAFDPCYNMSICTMYVHVADKTPPVTVCDNHTVATLNQHGEIHVYAETLDDGTFDDCQLDSFGVKRMDEGAACQAPDTLFMPYVRLCCADVGEPVMVIFRAWDHAGNFNDCMVEIEVQDKLPPRIYCPDSVMIACTDWLDSLDYTMFGDPRYTDNCNVVVTERIDRYINQCRIGTIERVFIATDDGGRADSCRQLIRVYDPSPFNGDSIIWPLDYTSNSGCLSGDLIPDNLQPPYDRPIYFDDECSLIAATYEDEIFTFVPDSNACFKIIRTWKVIDWCTFDRLGNYAQYIHQQVIKVNNIVAPEILEGCEEKTMCTYDPDCNDGFIELMARASDDCTPGEDLVWHLQIDLFDDRIIDVDDRGYGDSIDASGAYPIGRHRIKYSFEDLCGNKGTCTSYFEIINCKLPTAYCLNGIAVDLMPLDTNGDGTIDWGMIEIWASDLNLGSFHCNNDITFSFSRDTADKFRVFDCDSLGMRSVDMWVTDRVTGNQTYCRTHVIVQDNNDACPDSMTVQAMVAGIVTDDEGRALGEVEMVLSGAQHGMVKSNDVGAYGFQGLPVGEDYLIEPVLNGDPMDGVSTFDLVEIQRHLLGMDTLRSPYKLIAADVDRSRNISAKDLLFLRRMILGLEKDFGGEPSWRFIQTNYQFADPAAALEESFPEAFDIRELPGDMMYVDFTGIKIGDLNGSYTRLQGQTQTRQPIVLRQELISGPDAGTHVVSIRMESGADLAGMQFTLEYEADRWYWTGDWSASGMEQGESAVAEVWPGMISFSWMNLRAAGEFELQLVLAGEQKAPEMKITSGITRAEAYSASGLEYPLVLRAIRDLSEDPGLSVAPNPFSEEVRLSFDIADGHDYRLMVTDVAGRVLWSREDMGGPGPEWHRVLSGDLAGQGIYYAVLQTRETRIVKKMVFIPSR